jgi:large subunit ribosomal protein L23
MAEEKKKEAAKPAEKKPISKRAEKPAEKKAAEKKPAERPAGKPVKEKRFDHWKVLKYPHLAEKSMNMVEMENKLVFIVDRKATKAEVKKAVEKGFAVEVSGINVEITRKGVKKAYIKLKPGYEAVDIASRMGMI